MDWKEVLAKLRLIDISPKTEGKQIGGVNVNVEDKSDKRIYNFNFYGIERVEKLVAGDFKMSPELEKQVKEEAERRLIKLGISPDLLSESTRTEISSLTTATSAVDMIKGGKILKTGEVVTTKLSPEPKSEE
jgi:hypothetical protein